MAQQRSSDRRWQIPLLAALLAFGCGWFLMRRPVDANGAASVSVKLTALRADTYELFYDSAGRGFDGEHIVRVEVPASIEPQIIVFALPPLHNLHALRFDPGQRATDMDILEMRVNGPFRSWRLDGPSFAKHFTQTHDISSVSADSALASATIHCSGSDPYLATHEDLVTSTALLWATSPPVRAPLLVACVLALLTWLLVRWLFASNATEVDTPPTPREPIHMGAVVITSLLSLVLGWAVLRAMSYWITGERTVSVCIEGVFPKKDQVQVFYSRITGRFSVQQSVMRDVPGSDKQQVVVLPLSMDSTLNYMRLDPGSMQDSVRIDRLVFRCGTAEWALPPADLLARFKPAHDIDKAEVADGHLRITMNGPDPYLACDRDLAAELDQLRQRSTPGALPWTAAAFAALFLFLGQIRRVDASMKGDTMPVREAAMAGLFCLLIGLPLISGLVPMEPVMQNTEKRLLAGRPTFTLQNAFSYPAQFNTYYKDNFGFRKVLFRWNSLFYTCVLNTSPMTDRVVFGKDGWMFWAGENAMTQYRGTAHFTTDELARIAKVQEARRQWLAAQGIAYYLMIAPQKGTIYPEMLPDRLHRVCHYNIMSELVDYMRTHTHVTVVDSRAALLEAKKRDFVFYDVDTHWNPIGGFTGYTELMNAIVKDVPDVGTPVPMKWFTLLPDTNDEGDLATLIAVNDVRERVSPMMYPKEPFASVPMEVEPLIGNEYFRYAPVFRQVKGSQCPRLLMFRDSFAVYMIPFLSEHFSQSTYVWTPVFIPEIVQQEHPQVVVQELMELFVRDLLEDTQSQPRPPEH